MRDWERFVADRLARSTLPRDVQREVVTEIAAHLEEHEEELRQADAADAHAETLRQVADWRTFGRKIRHAKEDRMSVVRRVVMPGIAALALVLGALKLLVFLLIVPEACGPDATCILVSAEGPVYLPWLATLPFAGALSAMLARRAGARPKQQLTAAAFPALYLLIEFFVMSLVGGFFWRIPVYWVLIPALLGVLGAWPFLSGGHGRVPAQPMAPMHP
jgi:hypothetical protein